LSSSGLKRLNVWVQAKDLALDADKLVIPCLPADEKWGLTSQLKRSVSSIPANIAEGYGRFYFQANIQFCYNARGSLDETISHVLLGTEVGLIPLEISDAFIKKADALVILLNGYIAFLKKSKQGENELGLSHQTHELEAEYIINQSVVEEEFIELDDSQLSTL
jgi:four helix bundle protein